MNSRKRLLIEEWLPIAEVGEESMRERRSMTALPPTYYLHVWFARRPLVASRAAILGSLLPADFDRDKFMHLLGIHGDPVATKKRIAEANARGERLEVDVYGYPRAFQYLPAVSELPPAHRILDPTAGGGSIPFEAVSVGQDIISNDLNPVAALLLRCTVEFPLKYGSALLRRYQQLSTEFKRRAESHFADIFPPEAANVLNVDGYLWARTVTCPYCSGLVPLSPNWKLSASGAGVRLVPDALGGVRRIRFEMVKDAKQHSPGTIKGGIGLCPFPDCGRTIDGDDIKSQAKAQQMGHQLYCIVYKERRIKGRTKDGRPKYEKVRGFRSPRTQDDVDELVARN